MSNVEVWADNATGTLGGAAGPSPTPLVLSVAPATGTFPTLSAGEVFHLVIDFDTVNAEIVEVTAGTFSGGGWIFTLNSPGCVNDHNPGAQVALVITKEGLDNMLAESVLLDTYTTDGDIVYATGASAVTRLGIGSDTYVLTSNGTHPVWAAAVATPTGDAGGDLSGTYPDPTINSIQGVVISGTPAAGNGLYATGTDTAAWSALTATQAETIFNAEGDLLVGIGSGTGELLPIGSSGTWLNVGGSDPSGLQWVDLPAPALNTDAMTLTGGPVTATANTIVTVLTTDSLDVGTWLITVNALISMDAAATDPIILFLNPDTATATFVGPQRAQTPYPDGTTNPVPVSLTVLVQVTVAGTIDIDVFNIDTTYDATVEYEDNEGIPVAFVTGYTAVQVIGT